MLEIATCWTIAAIGFSLNSYVYKHPKTTILPYMLRHTWFSGFSQILSYCLLCLPFLFTASWPFAIFALALLITVFRNRGIQLIYDDLRAHSIDNRGVFCHSKNCYMHDGELASFMINRRTKLQMKTFPVNLEELE
jgi:hypothetical protein